MKFNFIRAIKLIYLRQLSKKMNYSNPSIEFKNLHLGEAIMF